MVKLSVGLAPEGYGGRPPSGSFLAYTVFSHHLHSVALSVPFPSSKDGSHTGIGASVMS